MEPWRLWICAIVVQALLLAPAYMQTAAAEGALGSLPSNLVDSGAAAAAAAGGRELLAAKKKAPTAKKKTPPKVAAKKKPAPKGKPAAKGKKPAVKTTNKPRKPVVSGGKAPATSTPGAPATARCFHAGLLLIGLSTDVLTTRPPARAQRRW